MARRRPKAAKRRSTRRSAPTHLASTDNANLVLVADVDILSDRLWVQAQNFLGQRVVSAFANNGDFVFNALDNLSGSAALIGLRSRATYTRPFTKVEELRRNADVQFRATEEQLQAELRDTEQKLGELQAARKDSSSLMMSPEQQAEVQKFLDEQVRIRQELRDGAPQSRPRHRQPRHHAQDPEHRAGAAAADDRGAGGRVRETPQKGQRMSQRNVLILLAHVVVLVALVLVGQRGASTGGR